MEDSTINLVTPPPIKVDEVSKEGSCENWNWYARDVSSEENQK